MTSSLDMIRGRQVVQSLTNQSGGSVIAGDVVIVSTANDESFTTTTSAAYNSTRVGVAQESIAAAATGRILLEGYAPLVNVSASATRGHYLLTHTVAKQATSQAGYVAGAFGQILKAGTTPSAMIFPVAQVGSSGASTADPFIIGQGTASDLSAKIQISGLSSSPDVNGTGGAGTSEEFDGADPFTYSSALTATDTNSTFKSCWYGNDTSGATRYVYKSWSPAGAFDARTKIEFSNDNQASSFAFLIMDSGTPITNGLLFNLEYSVGVASPFASSYTLLNCYTVSSTTPTSRNALTAIYSNQIYLRLTRDGSNNVSFYWSSNGRAWSLLVTASFTFTAARIGYRLYSGTNGKNIYVISDWLRTSV